MHIKKYTIFFLLSVLLSCNTSYQTQAVQYREIKVDKGSKGDKNLVSLIKPYSDSVNKSMNSVIAVADITLERKQPEGSLGNLVADIMLTSAREKYNTKVDLAVMNSGGIRLPYLTAGDITRGKIFELSPFDNIVVLQKISGTLLQEFLDHTASHGGWPVSGATLQIKNKKALNVKINNSPIDPNATYTLAVLDYIANGGDDAAMLRPIAQINNGNIFRDAIIEYLSGLNSTGKKVTAKIENRVTYAE